MDSAVDHPERSAADLAQRERDLLAVVGDLARELHPQHSRIDEISLSSRLAKNLGNEVDRQSNAEHALEA